MNIQKISRGGKRVRFWPSKAFSIVMFSDILAILPAAGMHLAILNDAVIFFFVGAFFPKKKNEKFSFQKNAPRTSLTQKVQTKII